MSPASLSRRSSTCSRIPTGLVIVTTGCEAYPTGISFRLLVLSKPPIDFVTEFAFSINQHRHAGSLDLTASATLRNGSEQPIVLGVFDGDRATRTRADFRLFRLVLDPWTVHNQHQP